jgi:hypothetical protein
VRTPRAEIHKSPVPDKAVVAHDGSAYPPSFTSDPQLLHTTPINAPTTSKMNSDPDEQAGVAHDQVCSLVTGIFSALPTSTLQAPSSPVSVNDDSAHSSETFRGESPMLIEDSDEEPADEREEDAALQDYRYIVSNSVVCIHRAIQRKENFELLMRIFASPRDSFELLLLCVLALLSSVYCF